VSVEGVREFLRQAAPDIEIIRTRASTATVEEAARVHGVSPSQIAKTLTLEAGGRAFLLVAAGDARLDNGKAKNAFGGRTRMLPREEVEALTGHPVGGVCPFGLPSPLDIYCDVSLQAHPLVLPAAGDIDAAIKISPARLADITNARWVDACHA
jgi:prolyl-tRNA editing enzyme YbaK/EbsC (Cys-tRNA(Pro) deacylase)